MALRAKTNVSVGSLAFGSISGTYAALKTGVERCRGLLFFSSLDKDVIISIDGGTTDFAWIPANSSFILNFEQFGLQYSGSLSVKQGGGGACTSGFISVSQLREA